MLGLAEALSVLSPSLFLIDELSASDFKTKLQEFQEAILSSRAEMPILNGVLLLYLAGRFENFVRQVFEDLTDTVASDRSEFNKLPKAMRENLIHYTAEIMQNPRKYGHAENGVAAFVGILSENLSGSLKNGVNSKCLSITLENMRPDILNDIFNRIGAVKIWERLGQQHQVQLHFGEDNADRATKEARAKLAEFMELRNRIAHPSGEMTWPGIDVAKGYIDFCEVLSTAIDGICQVWTSTLGKDTT
jgi:signal transduction histidine kinase